MPRPGSPEQVCCLSFSTKACPYTVLLVPQQKSLDYQLKVFTHGNVSLRKERQWFNRSLPTPVLLPGESHGQRSLVGCRPWGCEELETTEWLHFHFSVPCIGEGNGNPLQCSCLENPRDGGAWWAANYGVAQSRTWLKRLSSSSSSSVYMLIPNC